MRRYESRFTKNAYARRHVDTTQKTLTWPYSISFKRNRFYQLKNKSEDEETSSGKFTPGQTTWCVSHQVCVHVNMKVFYCLFLGLYGGSSV